MKLKLTSDQAPGIYSSRFIRKLLSSGMQCLAILYLGIHFRRDVNTYFLSFDVVNYELTTELTSKS